MTRQDSNLDLLIQNQRCYRITPRVNVCVRGDSNPLCHLDGCFTGNLSVAMKKYPLAAKWRYPVLAR